MRAWRNGRRARLRIWCLWRMSSSLIARTFLRHPICGSSSVGRAPPCQGGGSEFEPRNPLQQSRKRLCGSIAQLGEHLPYKQRVRGSSPFAPTNPGGLFGSVVQLVRTLACHARGRGFESLPSRHQFASVAQSVEQRTENPRVVGSIPTGGTRCGCSSSGRAPPCQGGGSEFEPRHPLQSNKIGTQGVPVFINGTVAKW